MNIRLVPVHQIKPYDNNVRIHSVKQLQALCKSINRFGFRQPIVIDKNNVIVAGHARYEAAATLGYENVPCEIVDDLSEDEINAYRILDNKIAEMGATDVQALEIEISKIPDFDFKPFNISFKPIKLPELKPEKIEEEKAPKIITCPRCKHEFTSDEDV